MPVENGKVEQFDRNSVEMESVKDETETSTQFLATDDLIRDLIEAVKEEGVLYKPTHKHFRHLIKKHQAYLSVANVLKAQGYADVTAERVKQKWNTIKSVYWRHRPNCGNPCDSGFTFCKDLQFLDKYEFRFYRNRKTNEKAEKQKAGNATAIVSANETDDGMNRLFEIINSIDAKIEPNSHQLPTNEPSEHSNHSEVQSVHDYNREQNATELLSNALKRPSNYEEETQSKKLNLLELELEHQRLVNERAEHQARQARAEADLMEVRLKQEKAKLRQLGISI